MKKYIASVGLSLVLMLSLVTPAFAYNLETGENVVLNQNLLDDTYVFAGNSTIKADIFGDLFAGGSFVVVDGNVQEDLVIAGGRVTVTGNVGGDLRVLGGMVTIYGNVGDDLVVAGGIVDIAQDAVIGGDVLVAADRLFLDGTVYGGVRGFLANFNLNGQIQKDVALTVQDSIFVSDDGHIEGNLEYFSLVESNIEQGVVDGVIQYNKFTKDFSKMFKVFLAYTVKSYLSALLLLLLAVLFAQNSLIKSSSLAKENPAKAFGVGVLTVVLMLITAFILMTTVIGIPIALILLLLFAIMFFVSKVFVAMFFATYVLKDSKKVKKPKLFGVLALVMLVYYLLSIIPLVGWVVNLALFFFGIGCITLLKIEQVKALRSKKLL